jgi:hypothetical protein
MPLLTPFVDYVLIGLIAVILALIAWLVVLQIRLSRLTRQYTHLMTGTDGKDLAEMLNRHVDEVRDAMATVSSLQTQSRQLERALKHSMQWTGFVRFNPFRDTGGNQSFTWTIADDYGNGVVLSSLHAREGTRVYAKPLYEWESTYALTEEEEQTIAQAKQQRG